MVCGSFAGILAGAVIGIIVGIFYHDLSLGLEGSLIGGACAALVGAGVGLFLGLWDAQVPSGFSEEILGRDGKPLSSPRGTRPLDISPSNRR